MTREKGDTVDFKYNGMDWTIEYGDGTHVYWYLKGKKTNSPPVYHIGQLKDKSFYYDLRDWMNGKQTFKKIYKENKMAKKKNRLQEVKDREASKKKILETIAGTKSYKTPIDNYKNGGKGIDLSLLAESGFKFATEDKDFLHKTKQELDRENKKIKKLNEGFFLGIGGQSVIGGNPFGSNKKEILKERRNPRELNIKLIFGGDETGEIGFISINGQESEDVSPNEAEKVFKKIEKMAIQLRDSL